MSIVDNSLFTSMLVFGTKSKNQGVNVLGIPKSWGQELLTNPIAPASRDCHKK